MVLTARVRWGQGEPIYGPKDEVDLDKFKKAVKGLPFWLAGYYARPEKLQVRCMQAHA